MEEINTTQCPTKSYHLTWLSKLFHLCIPFEDVVYLTQQARKKKKTQRRLHTYILLIKLEKTALRDDFSTAVTVHESSQSSSVQWQYVMIDSSNTTQDVRQTQEKQQRN